MGAVCYKPKPATITKEDVLRALNDKLVKDSITPYFKSQTIHSGTQSHWEYSFNHRNTQDATKSTVAAEANRGGTVKQSEHRLASGHRITSMLNMDTHGEHGGGLGMPKNTSTQVLKTQIVARVHGEHAVFNLFKATRQSADKGAPVGELREAATAAKRMNFVQQLEAQDDLQLKILSYFGVRDKVYDTLSIMSKDSLQFMRRNHDKMERKLPSMANERIRLAYVKSVEDHQSGVNQIIKLSEKEVVTASDDCTMKVWSVITPSTNQHQATLKSELQIQTETITCLVSSGALISSQPAGQNKRELLVAGCHSGNLILTNTSTIKSSASSTQIKKEQINVAHNNLIRVVCSLESLNHRYFATADVCGIIKVWHSSIKTSAVIEIDLKQAMSYNSMIELKGVLDQQGSSQFRDTAMIACALKNNKILLILLQPLERSYQIVKTITTQSQKPTCLIQLTKRHLAVGVGSLRETSKIEIHQISGNVERPPIAILSHHKDMIDTLLKVDLPKFHQSHKGSSQPSPNVQWLISASRDHQLTLWKFYGGHPMRRTQLNLANSQKRQNQSSRMLMSERMSAEDYINRKRSTFHKDQMTSQHNKGPKSSESSSEEDEDQAVNGNHLEASPLVKKKVNKTHKQVIQQRSGTGNLVGEPSNACEESKFDDYSQPDDSHINKDGSSPDMRVLGDRLAVEADNSPFLDHFYSVESGHKDFVRSLVQTNSNFTLITASEDKTIKLFSLTNGQSSAQTSQL